MRGFLRHWEPEQWPQLGVCVPLPGKAGAGGLLWGWGGQRGSEHTGAAQARPLSGPLKLPLESQARGGNAGIFGDDHRSAESREGGAQPRAPEGEALGWEQA